MASDSNGVATPSNPDVNGNHQAVSQAEADAASLQQLLHQVQDIPDDMADEDIAALLQRLEQADGLGKEVEGKLDSLIEQLNSLLGALQPAHNADDRTVETHDRVNDRKESGRQT